VKYPNIKNFVQTKNTVVQNLVLDAVEMSVSHLMSVFTSGIAGRSSQTRCLSNTAIQNNPLRFVAMKVVPEIALSTG
jgi:hypothetical protein